MRNRTLLMLLGGAVVLCGPVVHQAGAAPDPPGKRPPLGPPIDIWWSHTNQDRLIPINDPSHTNQDEVRPPKDPPPLPPSGAQGDPHEGRAWRFDPADFEDAGIGFGGPGGSAPLPPDPGGLLTVGGGPWEGVVGAPSPTTPSNGWTDAPVAMSTIPGAGVLPLLGLAGLTGRGRRRRR